MTIKKQMFRGRLSAAGFLFAFIFVLGLQVLLPNVTHADEYNIVEKAKAYAATRALDVCADNGSTNWKSAWSGSDYSLAEVSSGDIWERAVNPAISFTHNTVNSKSGFLVDQVDGNSACVTNEDVVAMFGAVGITGDKIGSFLVDIGVLELSDDKAGYNLTDRLDTNTKRANAIKNRLSRKFDINISKDMPDAMAYVALSAALKACKASPVKGGSKVVLVDAEGNKTTKYYSFENNDLVNAGYGLPFDDGNDGQLACTTIARGMVATADAFATAAKKASDTGDPLPGVSPFGSSGGGDTQKTQCEASWTNPLNWLMCAVFNMFAEASDAFYNSILQPFLYTPPISTDSEARTFKAWSNFRVLGNVFLIITMLIVVFGQTIGGGIVDAYTAKKILPKLLTGAILINLSVYIVALMVDITNILGNGISQLLLMPFNGVAGFELSTSAGLAGAGSVLGAGILGAGSIVGFLSAGMAVFPLIIFTIVIPTFFAMLSVFATLVIRQGIILALLISSPVAFALYVLPNTEQYFRKWWQLLFATLMVYPIVMSIFAISSIMSLMIVDANSGIGAGSIASIVAFSLQIIPLFLVPYAFKMAGGALANLQSTLTGIRDKGNGFFKERKEQAQSDFRRKSILNREQINQGLKLRSNQSSTAFGRKGYMFAANRVGGLNIAAAASEERAKQLKVMADQIATGDDAEVRALTVNAHMMRASKKGKKGLEDAGYKEGTDFTYDAKTHQIKLRNASGQMVYASDAQAGHARWGNDAAAVQKALSYEIQKSILPDQHDSIINNLAGWQQSLGIEDREMNGIIKGAGFEQQNHDKVYKHTSVKDGQVVVAGSKLVDEMHATMGTYQAFGQDADVYATMGNIYAEALPQALSGDADAEQTVKKMQQFAEQFRGQGDAAIEQVIRAQQEEEARRALAAGMPPPTQSAPAAVREAINDMIATIDNNGAISLNGPVGQSRKRRSNPEGGSSVKFDFKR